VHAEEEGRRSSSSSSSNRRLSPPSSLPPSSSLPGECFLLLSLLALTLCVLLAYPNPYFSLEQVWGGRKGGRKGARKGQENKVL